MSKPIKEEIDELILAFKSVSKLEPKNAEEGLREASRILVIMTKKPSIKASIGELVKTLATLRGYVGFENFEEFLKTIDYLEKIEIPEVYKSLRKEWKDTLIFLLTKKERIIYSLEDYKKFLAKFKSLKRKYIESYLKEHELQNRLLKNFCREFEQDANFKVLEAVSEVSKGLTKVSALQLKNEVIDRRKKACLNKLEDIRKILEYKATCTCGYNLIGLDDVDKTIKENEKAIFLRIKNEAIASLRKLLNSLTIKKSIFEKSLQKLPKDTSEKGYALPETVKEIVDKMKSNKATSKELLGIAELLTSLKEPIKRATEAAVIKRLSEIIKTIKEKYGFIVTVEELLGLIEGYGKETVIDVDI